MFNFLSRGDLKVILDKFQFSPGDSISGKVTLKLKKPIQANKLVISVTGEKIYTRPTVGRGVGLGGGFSFGPGVQSGMNEQTSVSKMFYFELPLDGSKEYTEGEYPFTVKLPNDINQTQNADNSGGAFGTVSKILSMTSGMSVRTEWFVEAKLDIPKAIDMREKVLINVG